MPQDTFTIRLLSRELDSVLRGGRINKIGQPGREELSFHIYTGRRALKLIVNANAAECGVYFTEETRENPAVAPNFCMLLRKYLSGAEILSVSTPGFERILQFRLHCVSDFSSCERMLVVEIMGKYSNVILTQEGKILGALKTTSLDENCRRTILPGVDYVSPRPQDKVSPEDLAALSALFSPLPEGDLARFLFSRVAGLAPCTAEQIVAAFRGGDFARHVRDYIFSDEASPCILCRDGVPVDFFARSVEGARPFPTISEAETVFYAKKRELRALDGLRRRLAAAVTSAKKKQEKRLAQILEKQRECSDCEENRVKGELITANLYRLEKGMNSCELPDFYEEKGATRKIRLDPLLSPSQNAQAYFRRYRKQKRTLEILVPQEREVRNELDYFTGLLTAVSVAETEKDLRCLEEELYSEGLLKAPEQRKKKNDPPSECRRYEHGGMKIEAGRNNLQNDRLLRSAAPEDLWMHVQNYHSCHVLIRTGGNPVSEQTLLFAAGICVRYSEARAGGKVAVDYCPAKYVKKPSGAKAGFVVYTEFRTLYAEASEGEELG